jgi:putative N6-adenine-specific DNA methylase
MLGLAIVNKGLEEITKEHIIEILNLESKKIKIEDSAVIFEIDNYEQLCKLSYLSQGSNRILLLLDIISFKDYEELEKKLELSVKKGLLNDAKNLLKNNLTFRASSKVHDDEIIDVTELEKSAGGLSYDYFVQEGIELKVDLKNPEFMLYLFVINKRCYFGIDFSGDISKRDYKIFNSSMSLKGTTAFGLLKIAGFKSNDCLLDTFCNSGTLEIEAALYANKISPRFYDKKFPFLKMNIFKDDAAQEKFFKTIDSLSSDKRLKITAADTLLRNISAAKKNAKIAGVEKFIEFRRIDTDWLDLKFEEKSVDRIITFIPGSSKHKSNAALEKQFKEFFYQAEYILKDDGIAAVLCLSPELLLKMSEEYLKLESERKIYSGEQMMKLLIFKKKK